MIRISGTSKRSAAEIVAKAAAFFGPEGLGLKEIRRERCCASFEGGGGHVVVSAIETGGRTTVDVESREWDHHATRFLETIA